MTGGQLISLLAAVLAGYVIARIWIPSVVERPSDNLMRTNVSGDRVPAVLGLPLVVGAVVGAGVVLVLDRIKPLPADTLEAVMAVTVVVCVAALAGYADDRRGDEPARGFIGHIRAGLVGSITGGLIKILGVGLAGAAAGLLTGSGWFVLECVALVGLTANLINLFDRAPGRAAKVSFLLLLPLIALGEGAWAAAVGGLMGGLLACVGPDLKERAMLGDAGANPLGAAAGLGLALSLDRPARLAAIGVLLVLNLVSEKWSFSRGIERTPPLRAADRLGRRD